MRMALYGRYSTDMQSEVSIEDQLRLCRELAEREGWIDDLEPYCDYGISGASMQNRPGIQSLLADAASKRFDIIVAESVDRLSRDQEDIAGIYKRVSFEGIQIHTLAEGPVNELHIGLKGTMGALFLKDLAAKTKRGMRGRIEAGKAGGGKSYGYDVPKKFDENGEPVRGERTINLDDVQVITEIFNRYADGESPRAIAINLNARCITGPTGKTWGPSTINGNKTRGTGILNNELYIGRMVWNRLKYIKDPATGKRVSRLNPKNEWVIKDVPELRIVSDDLWQKVKARQEIQSQTAFAKGYKPLVRRKRAQHLLSGLVKCGVCGGGMVNVNAERTGCASARNKGTCSNVKTIKRDVLERRVLEGLKYHLLHTDMFTEFCKKYTQRINTLKKEKNAAFNSAKGELAKLELDQEKFLDAIVNGVPAERVRDRMHDNEAKIKELEAFIGDYTEDPVVLHPAMADMYSQAVDNLIATLNSDTETSTQAALAVRALISTITLTPAPEGGNKPYIVEIDGVLADMFNLALKEAGKEKRPLSESDLNPSTMMVAGAGFEPTEGPGFVKCRMSPIG